MSSNKNSKQPSPPGRLMSLDVFRGLTILGMLLVNNTALDTATPKHLTHAAWNQGIYAADMVFPWFLFIVGAAIPYAAASARKHGVSGWRHYLKALKRTAMLVLLGCLIDSSIAKTPVIGLGVLQIIGLAYLVATLVYPLKMHWRLAVASVLLLAHWGLIRFVPFAGGSAGVFTENVNIIKHINDTYLSVYHVKGLLSVVPTSAMVLIGTVVGDVLRLDLQAAKKALWITSGGIVLGLLGLLWTIDLPFNKPVWTSSYILYTAGWAAAIFGLVYFVVDVKGWRAWAFPFAVFGMNAIAAYVVPIIVKIYVLQGWTWTLPDGSRLPLAGAYLRLCTDAAGRIYGGWLYMASYLLAWWLIMFVLYRKGMFLKV